MKIKAIFLIICIFSPFTAFASTAACPLLNGINVHTSKRILNICKNGSVVKTFDVEALMAYNAYKSGDTKAFQSLISGLSKDKKNKLFANVERYARLSNGDL